MTAVRVGFVQWPEGLSADDARWGQLSESVAAAEPEILLTNELPFGPWVATGEKFSENAARASIAEHERGLRRLNELRVPAVISSRPVSNGRRLTNEAFVLEDGATRALHRKQYFPNEPGWFECEWYEADGSGFAVAEVRGLRLGVLVCSELMFNERARAYGREGVSLIVVPRASGKDVETWQIAAAMGALTSGAYVVSSNRVGAAHEGSEAGPIFGGAGFAYSPRGQLLDMTNSGCPVKTVEIDVELAVKAQQAYPVTLKG